MLDRIIQRYKGDRREDGLVEFSSVTAAFTCRHFAWLHGDGQSLVVTSVARGFSEELLSAIVKTTASLRLFGLPSPISLWPGLYNKLNPAMGVLAAITPSYHGHFANWDGDVARRTFQVFPAYRTDFGGWESEDMYDDLIHSRTSILAWDRMARPQIRLQVKSAHGAIEGWLGDAFMWADWRDIDREVPKLVEPHELAVIRNYLDQEVRVRRDAGETFTVDDDATGVVRMEGTSEVLQHLRSFVGEVDQPTFF